MKKLKNIGVVAILIALLIQFIPAPKAYAVTYEEFIVGVTNPISRTVDVEGTLNITTAGNYVLEIENTDNINEDTVMELYNYSHVLLATNDDNSNNSENGKLSTIATYLNIGTYYVRIKTKDYQEVIGHFRADRIDDIETIDLNSNKIFQAAGANNYVTHKEFKFTLDSNKDIVLETSAGNSKALDTTLTLYDANHNIIARNDNIDGTNGNNFSRIEKQLSQGTYYVKYDEHGDPLFETTALSLSDNSKPYAYITSPKNQGYILRDEVRRFEVNASKDATALDLDYVINGETINLSDNLVWNNSLNSYIADVNITQSMFRYVESVDGQFNFPKFKINITSSKGTNSNDIEGVITWNSREFYLGLDPNFVYNDEIDNNFVGLATDEYNCMAYVLGFTDEYYWPWSPAAVGIDFESVKRFFTGVGYEERRGYRFSEVSQTVMPYAEAIYYEGHVAVVTAWDENGMPAEVTAKIGPGEVLKSDVSMGQMLSYGQPLAYMKGRH